jgi:hypothetical protein
MIGWYGQANSVRINQIKKLPDDILKWNLKLFHIIFIIDSKYEFDIILCMYAQHTIIDYTIYIHQLPYESFTKVWTFNFKMITHCHCYPIISFDIKQVRQQSHLLCCYSKCFCKSQI